MSSGLAGHEFGHSLVWSAAATATVLALTYAASRRTGRHHVVDVAWGLIFAAIATSAFLTSSGSGDAARRWLLLGTTTVWGLRLAGHIAVRNRGRAEDPRYAAMLAGHGTLYVLLKVYLLQGALAYLISLPVQVGCFLGPPLTWLAALGLACWTVGITFETVGDHQLRRYQADADRPAVLDTGLWRYTRHPNYFGDACVWLGIFLIAADRWPGGLTVISPIVMIYLLVFGSGQRLVERHLSRRPAYRAYMRRTSGFIPLPPRGPADPPQSER